MRIYDISRELFSAYVYPGDPCPQKEVFNEIGKESACNLTLLSMGSHNGTHVDAPLHFCPDGRDVSQLDLNKCVGICKVVEHSGKLEAKVVLELLADGTKKLLFKGAVVITPEAARVMATAQIHLLGVEGQTVGDVKNHIEVHRELLSHEIVILEALDLHEVSCGKYMLAAQPLKMKGLDGSQVRAILIEVK